MLQINEDINDDLFRRAAENYPLKTDNPDWETVLNKMNTVPPAGHDHIAKKRKNNYRYLLLLLLLIPMAIFESTRSFKSNSSTEKNNLTENTAIAKQAPVQTGPVAVLSNETPGTSTNKTAAETNPANTNSVEPAPVQADIQKNNNVLVNTVDDNTVAAGRKHKASSGQRSKSTIQNAQPVEDEVAASTFSKDELNGKKPVNTNKDIATGTEKETIAAVKKETASEIKTDVTEAGTVTGKTNNETVNTDNDKTLANDTKTKQAEKVKVKNDQPVAAKENKKDKARTKHFYAGILAAPDVSAIKLQSMKKIGFNYGIIAGYKLTKRISIETGLLQDRKYYSTDGKYFSTKNIYIYPNATLEHVDGVCKMLELPINVSYTFSKKARSSWFGSVGVSSYFMQHESYTYQINNNGYRYTKDSYYSNKSTSLLAMINISAGYTYKLGKIGDLRFEPYIKLPVNKIGTGKLPIQSGGIFIGFTKMIF